jgi:DNA-binding NtrC family response regulator
MTNKGKMEKILVVDDEVDIAFSLKTVLERNRLVHGFWL